MVESNTSLVYFHVVPKRSQKDKSELQSLPADCGRDEQIRQKGGGRKPYDQTMVDIDARFLSILHDHTAGSPMDEEIVWTDLTPSQIQVAYQETYGETISETVIRKLLKKHHYRSRKALKKRP